MDGQLLRWLYHRLLHDPTLSHTTDCTFGDGIIVLVYLYGVLNNRSSRWASDRRNWPLWCRRLRLPSYSQLRKRLKTESAMQAIQRLNAELRQQLPSGQEKVVDGKPLVIGGYSKDPDAQWGKVPDGWAKGYKWHAIIDAGGAIDAIEVTSLRCGEATILRQSLMQQLDLRGVTLRGDANYDSNPSYRAMAQAGGRLIAPRRKPGTGIGHHPQHCDRLAAIAELERTEDGLARHKRRRNRIEQCFGHVGNLPFGLWALPNFVRRRPRVRMWVVSKVMLYHLHQVLALPHAAAA